MRRASSIASRDPRVPACSSFSRLRLRCFVLCLGETGLTNPPIGQALATDGNEQQFVALVILDADSRAAVVVGVELGKVAVQVRFAAMLKLAPHTRLNTGNRFSDGLV